MREGNQKNVMWQKQQDVGWCWRTMSLRSVLLVSLYDKNSDKMYVPTQLLLQFTHELKYNKRNEGLMAKLRKLQGSTRYAMKEQLKKNRWLISLFMWKCPCPSCLNVSSSSQQVSTSLGRAQWTWVELDRVFMTRTVTGCMHPLSSYHIAHMNRSTKGKTRNTWGMNNKR